ncbi:MAG: lactate utilization protein [Gemmataceae bacterium]
MSTREAFLAKVRTAVAEGNRAGTVPSHPGRSKVGYQGAGGDPVSKFCTEFTLAGGFSFVAEDDDAAWRKIEEIIRRHDAKNIVIGVGEVMDRLNLKGRLGNLVGTSIFTCSNESNESTNSDKFINLSPRKADKETYFASDLGISTVRHLIAETGTIVMATQPDQPRSISLLPPVHIAIASRSQILPDLFDLFDLFSPTADSNNPPACLTLITGPSKTGDIELKLVTGVHGPGEVHVVIVD